MMSDWTEYNSTMKWPENDNFKWEVRLDGAWTETDTPFDDWDTGLRVRYRGCEPEMPKLIFKRNNCYSVVGNVMEEWVRLAAPIAAYHKDMKYMACDEDGEVYVYEEMPSTCGQYWYNDINDNERIATIPKEAMPENCKTAIVELVHEEDGDES
jgi:hypothetical protein